jgi:imidazole glycerol phosphate synthase glutamine amidotransferase subunit
MRRWPEGQAVITIVDYGLGNIQAIANIYRRLDIPVTLAQDAATLAQAQRIVLPGVGAFDWAMPTHARHARDAGPLVLHDRRPVLGICVGMQILARGSEEGTRPGLGWIEGQVRSLRALQQDVPLPMPHMGWNDVAPRAGEALFAGLEHDAPSISCTPTTEAHDTADVVGEMTTAEAAGRCAAATSWACSSTSEKSHQWASAY